MWLDSLVSEKPNQLHQYNSPFPSFCFGPGCAECCGHCSRSLRCWLVRPAPGWSSRCCVLATHPSLKPHPKYKAHIFIFGRQTKGSTGIYILGFNDTFLEKAQNCSPTMTNVGWTWGSSGVSKIWWAYIINVYLTLKGTLSNEATTLARFYF